MDKTSAREKGFPQMRSPNNPYHSRHQGSQDSNTLPSFDAPRMPASAVRSRTPVRAVFDDLSTAHSSITSRSGSGGYRTISANQSEDSIPLEDLKPRQGLLHQLPLPPLPAVLTTRDKSNRHPGVQFEPKQNFESDQRARGTQSEAGLVGEDRKEPSLPATRLYPKTYKIPSSPTKHWPRDSLELDNPSSPKRFNGRGKDRSSSQYPDTPPALKEVSHANARGIDEVLHDDEYDGGAPLQRFKPAPTVGHHLPRELSNTQTEQSSIPESSTIGKIYKSYVRSQAMEEDVGDSDEDELPVMTASHYQHRVASRGRSLTGADITSSSSELNIRGRSLTGGEFASSSSILDTTSSKDRRASALQARKQKRAERKLGKAPGRPPSGALPEAPDYAKPRLVPSSSEGLHPSTTYGDTRNLLEITQKTGWSAKPSNFANSEYQLSPDRYVPPTAAAPHVDSNNAYNIQSSPEVVVSRASTHSDQFEYDGPNYSLLLHQQNRHRPLERDISNVLRHVSTYSNGSVSSSILRDTAIFQSEASDPVGADIPRNLTLANTVGTAAAETLADDNSLPAEDSAFYAHGALAQDWLDNDRRNVVRVPISQNTKQFDHAAFSRLDNAGAGGHLVPRTSEDDGNDWETVGESAFGLDKIANKNPDGMLGGGFRRAGSSLANVSDEGSEHTARDGYIPQLREFSSTERIAQHPATIEYDGSYRQRDLKKTKQPIFLPIYGEHKVNGYLADSSRLRAPPNRFNVQPNPLASQHTNPFSTDPPEVLSNSNPERRHVRQKASGHHLYRYSIDDASIDTDLTEQQVPPVPVRNQNIEPLPLPDITVRTFNWMDQFGDPGPAIGRQEQPSQQKSRQLLRPETPDRPSSWQHVIALANGQPVRGYSPGGTRLQTASPLESHGVPDSNGFTEVPTYGHGANSRGDKDGDRRTRILNRFNKSKPDRPIGTRGLREISLVEAHRPMTPSIAPAVGRNPNDDVRPNDFSYRSPLAPPKSKEWRRMYRFSQLFKFEKDAKTDGMMELSPLGQDRPSGGSRRHLWEAPRMTPWPRDSSVLPLDLSRRRKNISLTVLLLCNICPPLLVLYAIGRLDGVILWYTRGDISSFGKGQKRAAYFLMGVWGAAVVFGLIIFLVYSLHHN